MHAIKMIFLLFLSAMIMGITPCRADTDVVTITLPEKIIGQSLESSLPLPLNPDRGLLEGSLVLEKIDRFGLGVNSAVIRGLIRGKNLVLTTRIGDQDLKLKLGELRLPMTCDFTFRFDPLDKKLYVTPHLANSPGETPSDQANKVLPLLALLNNREYPLSFESMKRFEARVGQRHLAVEMEPVDILVSPGQITLKMIPKVSKTD